MNPLRVAIIFHNSLLAAGIASWLAEAGFTDVSLLDAIQFNSPEKVQAQRPNVIIYDASDLYVTENLSFFTLLREIPGVQILQVNCEKDVVQIYYSQQKAAHEMGEFISLMQNIPASTD